MNNNQFLHKGWLNKQSRFLKKWRRRYVVLSKSHLLTFKSENINDAPTETIQIKTCKSIKSADSQTGKPHSFCIHGNDIEYNFYADTEDDKNKWIGLVS